MLSLKRFDPWIIFGAATLFGVGLAAITSVGLSRGGDFIFLQKQLIAAALGVTALIFLSTKHISAYRSYAWVVYWLGLISLIAVMFFGRTLNGTTGWFVLGGLAFQPLEFVKVALILSISRLLADKINGLPAWEDILKTGALTALPVILLLLQPDLGGAIIVASIWITIIFYFGLRRSQIAAVLLSALVFGVVGWFFVLHDYQKERFYTFLDPASDPLASGYNVNQAMIAIGSGGFLGRGLGEGSQSQLRFLPESQTDFVFAVISEELGFLGVLLVIGGFSLLVLRLISLAKRQTDPFSASVIAGGASLLATEALIHIGANIAIMPATGIALPLVSYGGSSLLVTLALLGILLSATASTPRI